MEESRFGPDPQRRAAARGGQGLPLGMKPPAASCWRAFRAVRAVRHCRPPRSRPPASGVLTEKEVVCLADKLVRCDRRAWPCGIVSARCWPCTAATREACAAIRGRMENALALAALVEAASGQRIEEIIQGCRRERNLSHPPRRDHPVSPLPLRGADWILPRTDRGGRRLQG